ncbi:DUF998 domain-containing protein [Enterococcus wangshanyuanii]|uniref:Membrane protein n=1 Tax=Enterococcus wangshanyuanii TaxID=2005703 RepID=A0ABQ1P4L6_9ENTE|nr:DUF998 domain-containing protein [Enterococcus wangshanyuanii]GGC90275.1 membrane protein [Enterococcus wangshanyuanii]
MSLLKKYGWYFLLFGVISDLLTPYVLGLFYPKMNQLTMVISVFGDVASPVRQAFLIWSVISGVFFVLALPVIYQSFSKISQPLALILTSAVGFYGVGDCIFTGLFSIDTEKSTWTFSTWVHNIGSGLGYAGFLLFPLFLILLYRKQGNRKLIHFYSLLLVLSLFSAGIYGLARIPTINELPLLNNIGLCQRISFIFNYIPLAILSIQQIRDTKEKGEK